MEKRLFRSFRGVVCRRDSARQAAGKSRLTAETMWERSYLAACPGGRETVHRSFGHECVLEFGYRPEYLEEHPANGGGGVDALVEDDQIDTTALQLIGQLDEVLGSRAAIATRSPTPG